MKLSKMITVFVFAGVFLIVGFVSLAMAGFEPGDGETVAGPVMWGVGVIDCPQGSNCTATMRVKMVEDCDVSTKAVDESAMSSGSIPSPPSGPQDVLNVQFAPNSFFDLPCTAIITKVKNWWQNDATAPTLWSFDAQIKFIVGDDSTSCTAQ